MDQSFFLCEVDQNTPLTRLVEKVEEPDPFTKEVGTGTPQAETSGLQRHCKGVYADLTIISARCRVQQPGSSDEKVAINFHLNHEPAQFMDRLFQVADYV